MYVPLLNRLLQIISYEAPEVVVWAKDDSTKYDPTEKLVLYGGVANASSTYDLLWTQVWASSRYVEQSIVARLTHGILAF